MSRSADTIYALSSGSLPAGLAVVRVSGSRVEALLVELFGTVPAPRQALLKSIHDRNGQVIDNGLVIYFQAPRSFTGEDCVEFQLHGGRAVVATMSKRLADFGLRQAEAGEFSRRAFENGKLDLVEVEGLADLASAETEMQRRLAMEQSSGRLSGLYQGWMTQLTRCRALIEAELDFPDEDDIPGAVSNQVWEKVALISSEIEAHLQGHKVAEIIRDGFKVVIAGRPNAGKSSLMNALARRDVAIVTDIAGTTRDLIAVDLDLGGYFVRLTDTAGLRESDDRVEIEGIRRTHLSLEQADLILHLRDIRDDVPYEAIEAGAPILHVATKLDMVQEAEIGGSAGELQISMTTGDGIDSLVKRILNEVESRIYHGSQLSVARQRQSDLLKEVQLILRNCIEGKQLNLEVRSEYLRRAAHTLGKITGFVDTEDLLDVIFSEFCIGK